MFISSKSKFEDRENDAIFPVCDIKGLRKCVDGWDNVIIATELRSPTVSRDPVAVEPAARAEAAPVSHATQRER